MKLKHILFLFGFFPFLSTKADEDFKEYEIRVIRNKYFQKRLRFELGADVWNLLNRPFVYIAMANGGAHFHITESIAVGAEGAVATTFNKDECTILGDQFSIEPLVFPMHWMVGGFAELTPIYGKYQLSGGDVLYFDWALKLGAGKAGVSLRRTGCVSPSIAAASATDKSNLPVQSLTHFNIGGGQRLFFTKNWVVNWNLRLFLVDKYRQETDDGQQITPTTSIMDYDQNVFLNLGASYYF